MPQLFAVSSSSVKADHQPSFEAEGPEVVGKCDNLRFPGRGQRETPIARTKEDAYYILGLLPGQDETVPED